MKLDILFHYNVDEQTGEITYLGKEEVTVDTKASSSKTTVKVDENPDPIITLDPGKLILTQGAVDMLKATTGCRIDIKYKKKGKTAVPVISATFSSGNKLTKSNTISYRGSANERLAAYGSTFKLEPTEDEGVFYLVGDKNEEEQTIPDELVDIDKELDNNLDDLNNFDFSL